MILPSRYCFASLFFIVLGFAADSNGQGRYALIERASGQPVSLAVLELQGTSPFGLADIVSLEWTDVGSARLTDRLNFNVPAGVYPETFTMISGELRTDPTTLGLIPGDTGAANVLSVNAPSAHMGIEEMAGAVQLEFREPDINRINYNGTHFLRAQFSGQWILDQTNLCDFDSDGGCRLDDINLLVGALGSIDPTFDVNGDGGSIDQADVNEWLVIAGTWNIGRAYVRGDTNLDGRVDATDLNTLAMNWQLDDAAIARWGGGDFNGDRVFDTKDLNVIGANW